MVPHSVHVHRLQPEGLPVPQQYRGASAKEEDQSEDEEYRHRWLSASSATI